MVRRHVGIDNVNTNDIQSSRGDPVRIESFEWDRADDAGGNTAHISRHGISPEDVEEALTSNPLVLRGPDGRYLGTESPLTAVGYSFRSSRRGRASCGP